MARGADRELKRLENHLISLEAEDAQRIGAPGKKLKAYNSDKTDLDLDAYSEAVREPKKGGCLGWLVALVLLAALAAGLYWMYQNGGLPWN